MAENINIKLNIDASNSNRSIKDLTKLIDELTATMLKTKIGTKEFDNLASKLSNTRNELNNLKTNFDNLNPQIELDTEPAKNSIAELEARLEVLLAKVKLVDIGSEEFKKLQKEISQVNVELRETSKKLEGLDFEQTAGELGKVAGGVAAAFTGITAVIGQGNSEFEAFATNVLAGMAAAQGLKGALEAVSGAQKLLNSVMNANPMYKMLTVVSALVGAFTLLYIRQKSNEKATREAAAQQEEYTNKLRDSRKALLDLSLSIAESNKNLTDQIFLQKEIIELDYLKEISELGKEYGLTAEEINNTNQSMAVYSKSIQDIAQYELELNELRSQGTQLTEEQKQTETELKVLLEEAKKQRISDLLDLQKRLKRQSDGEKVLNIQTTEVILNAYIRKNQKIKQSGDDLLKNATKNNKDLVDNTEEAVKQLTKYRLDYYDQIIQREKDTAIVREQNRLQELLDGNAVLEEITKQREKITQITIAQKETEQRLLRRKRIEEIQDLIKSTKENIDALKEELITTQNRAKVEAKISDQRKLLLKEEQELKALINRDDKEDAEEIKLLREELVKDNIKYLRDLINNQYGDLIKLREDEFNNEIEVSQRRIEIYKSDYETRTKFLRDQLVENRGMELEERQKIIDQIQLIERQYNDNRLIEEQKILHAQTKARQKQAQLDITWSLNKYEGVFRKINEENLNSLYEIGADFERFTFDALKKQEDSLGVLLKTVVDETKKYIENETEKVIDPLKSKIAELRADTKKANSEEIKDLENKLAIEERTVRLLDLRLRELDGIRKKEIEYQNDVRKGEYENAQLQILILDKAKERREVRLQELQTLQLQRQAITEVYNAEIERYNGNLIRQNEATNKMLMIRRDMELTSLETLYTQELINHEEYEKGKENIEAVYRRRRIEADMEGYRKVMEFASTATNAMFDITKNQQDAIFEDRVEKAQETYDNESKALQQAKDNELITEDQYNKEIERINEEKAKKERKIEYDKAKRDKEAALSKAAIENAINIIEAIPNPAAVALATFVGLSQLAVIRSQPLPEYEKGGLLKGKRHANGGIPLIAEEGEIILNRNVSQNPAMLQLASLMNESTGGKRLVNTTFNTNSQPVMNKDMDIKGMVKEIVDGVVSIPIKNVAVDTDKTARKVKNIENKAKI